MAKDEKKTEEAATTTTESRRGRAVILSNGQKRAEYIRNRYYDDKVSRSDIVKELKEKFNHEVPYQIVFQATKEKEKPVPKVKEEAEKPKEDAKAE